MPAVLRQTLIVLPALNEAETIEAVIREVLECLPGVAVLVVDDGSTDATGQLASQCGANVATLPFNLGVGGAMRLGFRYALEHGFRNVVQIDADGQHDPRNVPALLAELEDHDLVIGARFSGEGEYAVKGPRKWAMKVLSATLTRLAKVPLADTTSGFKASGPRAVLLFSDHYPAEYLGDTVEALVIASRSGFRITQVPVSMRPRAGGTPSHDPLKAGVYLARAVIALLFALLRPALISRTAATL